MAGENTLRPLFRLREQTVQVSKLKDEDLMRSKNLLERKVFSTGGQLEDSFLTGQLGAVVSKGTRTKSKRGVVNAHANLGSVIEAVDKGLCQFGWTLRTREGL